MNLKNLIVAASAIILVSSCTVEGEVPSDAEILAEELKKVIRDYDIQTIVPYEWGLDVTTNDYNWVYSFGSYTYELVGGRVDSWTFYDFEVYDFEILRNSLRAETVYYPLTKLNRYIVDRDRLLIYFD